MSNANQASITQKKKPIDPIERVIGKVNSYLNYFGYKTLYKRPRKGTAFIYGVREGYPRDLRVTIQETARGTAVSFKHDNQWKLLLSALPYITLFILGTLLYFIPSSTKNKAWDFLHLNIEQLFFNQSLTITSLIILLLFTGGIIYFEYLIRNGRLYTLKGRFGYYTKDAIWQPNDTPLISDFIRIGFNQGFVLYLFSVLYYSPLALPPETLTRLLAVYGVSPNALKAAIHVTIIITIIPIISVYSGSKAYAFLKFRAEVENSNRLRSNTMERYLQLMSYGVLTASLSTLIGFMLVISFFGFAEETWLYLLFILFMFLGGIVGAFTKREGEEWVLGFVIAWVFAVSVYLVFNTGKTASYAWIIIFNFFFLLFPLFIYLQDKLIEYFKKDAYSPMWYVTPFPFMFYYVAITSMIRDLKGAKTEKAPSFAFQTDEEAVDDEQWRKVFINKERILEKGKEEYLLASMYLKALQAYVDSYKNQKDLILLPHFDELARWLRQKTSDRITITEQDIAIADAILWDPDYKITSDGLSRFIQAKNAFESVLEFIKE